MAIPSTLMRILLTLGLAAAFAAPGYAAERKLVALVEIGGFRSWPVLVELARELEARHPGLRVQLVEMGGAAGAQDKNKFLLAGGMQLDVARIDVTEFAAYLHEGALIDLQPYFDADPAWDATEYFAAPLSALRDGRGHLYGLPSTFTPYVLYLNLDLIEGAGLARPRPGWTWEEFLELARRTTVQREGRIEQYGVSLTQWLQAVAPWVWQNGGRLLEPGGERAGMGSAEFVGAMRFLRSLLHEERVASFDASFEAQLSQGLFQAGKAAMYGPVGYWETYRFQFIRDFRWDVAPLPRGSEAATSVAMTAYVVPRTSAEPELAYEFVRMLASERYQRTLAEIGNGVPGLKSAARSPSFLKPGAPPASAEVFLEELPHARFLPPLANWRKIESLCQADLAGILLAPDFDVEAACARMAARTDEFLARERTRRDRARLPAGTLELTLGLSVLLLLAGFALRSGWVGRGARGVRGGAREERAGYGMLALWAAGFLLFLFGPAVVTLLLSFCEWSPLRELDDARFVGLENYQRLAGDGTFRTSLWATVLYAALSVPLSLALALALALLLVSESRAASLVRTLCYVPAILSPVIVAALWRWILDPERGLANDLLASIGIQGPAWLREPSWVVPSFVIVSLWGVGAQMLIFIAGLKALDRATLEAARVDGAGPLRRFWHVTLPALSPVVLFNGVTGLILAVQIFAQPYVMTQGGPGDASRFLVLYLFESGFRHLDMGYASAIAWVLFVGLAASCLLLMGIARRWVYYAGGERS